MYIAEGSATSLLQPVLDNQVCRACCSGATQQAVHQRAAPHLRLHAVVNSVFRVCRNARCPGRRGDRREGWIRNCAEEEAHGPSHPVGHDTLSRMQGIPEWGVRPSTAGERSVLTRAPCPLPVRRDGGPHQGRLHKRGRARECLATSPVSRGQRTSQATKACTRLRQAAFGGDASFVCRISTPVTSWTST